MDEKDMILEELLLEFGSDSPENIPEKPIAEPISDEQVLSELEGSAAEATPVKKKRPRKETIVTEKTVKEKLPLSKRILRFAGRLALILLETVLLLVITLYGVMFVLAKGPSPTARDLFVRSVRETSAIGFLANIYFTEEEIAAIENSQQIEEYQETDTSLITITKPEDKSESDGPVADE